MKNKHYCFRFLCYVKIVLFIGVLYAVCNNSFCGELLDCYIDINNSGIQATDNEKKYIQDCNQNNNNAGNELFRCVKKTGDSTALEDGYLTCGFKKNDFFKCEKDRIGSAKCTTTGKAGVIDDCTKYANQEAIKGQPINDASGNNTGAVEKMPCYPENHICNKYNEDTYKGYYKKDFDIADGNGNVVSFFFIYKKNVKPNSNCTLKVFTCDFKLKNESNVAGEKNMVFSDTKNGFNKEFLNNIDGKLGDMAFFKYVGSCEYDKCKNYNNNILTQPYYYKYVHSASGNVNGNTIVSYFEKNVSANKIGVLCNKYLSNCADLRPSGSPGALYNNIKNANNNEARTKFYNTADTNKKEVREEHLWFVDSTAGVNANCLAIGDNVDTSRLDIGYCSDLNEKMDNLKYPNGLTTSGEISKNKFPNCYLKSCIDLTEDELSIISSKGVNNSKYCSEYYWLSNQKGLKYFPKEKPIFCSDVETVGGKGKQLKFRGGLYEAKTCTTKKVNNIKYDVPDVYDNGDCKKVAGIEYYSYGGGRNKDKDNCYLKNCFSLTKEEREAVSKAKFTNIGFEIDRAFAIDGAADVETDYDPTNLPVYCDNGFLFNNKFPGYGGFNPIDLNIIPCYELKISNIGAIPFSSFLKNGHNTTNESRLCRTSYRPFNLTQNSKTFSESFLGTMAVIANETPQITSSEDNISKLPDFSGAGVGMVKFDNQKLKSDFKSPDRYLYYNICSYVDNNFLYYNAEIQSLKGSELKSSSKLAKSLQKVKQKSEKYSECLNNSKREPKDIANAEDNDACKNACFHNANLEECLYNFTEKDCKEYVNNEYLCKHNGSCETNDRYCNFEDKLKEHLVNCASYRSSSEETFYFDCELYDVNINNNDYKNDILELFKIDNKDNIEVINKACESIIPLGESRSLVQPNILYKLIKPNKIELNKNLNISNIQKNKTRPKKYDIERYGCSKYDKESLDYGLYGCKLPDFQSTYISTMFDGTMADGEDKPTVARLKLTSEEDASHETNRESNSDQNSTLLKRGLNICSRYPDDVYNKKCGEREQGRYGDNACITLTDDKRADNLEDPSSNKWVFGESTGATRFRINRINRDVFVFRDFHTYHYCYSDFNREFKDGDSYGIVFGEGVLMFTPLVVGFCLLSCAAAGPFAIFCIPACIPSGIAAASALYTLARIDEWQINLQNDIFIPRGYINNLLSPPKNDSKDKDKKKENTESENTVAVTAGSAKDENKNSVKKEPDYAEIYHDKGMITRALLTNNDNYVYRFYPRSDKIEIDIKNKLENNIKDGNRFFYETTLGVDIIKKCKLSNLLTNSTKCSDWKRCDYSYQYNKLDSEGKITGECGSKKIKNCLDPVLIECVESYGVRFFDEEGDYSFLNKERKLNEIDENLTLKDGGFLKTYRNSDIVSDTWGTSSNENTRTWVSVDIVYYTKDTQTVEQLKSNKNCEMGVYGDPIGDLSKCRGFEIDCNNTKDKKICSLLGDKYKDYKGFHSESQSTKLPLFGSPFFFYTLITPKNTPNLFDPSFFLKAFYSYFGHSSSKEDGKREVFYSAEGVLLDFFNPKLEFSYSYNGGVSGNAYKNVYESYNNYISSVDSDSLYSPPYVVKYKSDLIAERKYNYALLKWYSTGLHGEYVPELRVYRIASMEKNDNSNLALDLAKCNSQIGIQCAEGEKFISIDNKVGVYKRAPLDLNNFTLKQLTKEQIKFAGFDGPYFENPRIEVFIGPVKNSYAGNNVGIKSNTGKVYLLKQGDEKYIKDFGKSEVQGYGINLTRSQCSKLYYDYYHYLNELEKEKRNANNPKEINRLNKSILTIDSTIRMDCDQENGEETEVLINESKMLAIKYIKDNPDEKKVIAKETTIVKRYNESYGGFNEVCISDYDIDKIFELRKNYSMSNTKMPFVLAFRDTSNRQRKTKCVLNRESRNRTECLVADRVYVYCSSSEIENKSSKCNKYLDLNNLKVVQLKSFDCAILNADKTGKKVVNPKITKDLDQMESDYIDMLRACFKGGFNYSGNVQRDKYNGIDTEFVDPCVCEILGSDSSVKNQDLYTSRSMTPREYGLCVDLEKPEICPAVRYYGVDKNYVDDSLALNKTKEELDRDKHEDYYEQHLWRTQEKQLGVLPSVFYTKTLGHAEFPASTYCSDYEQDCVGGSKVVAGECRGYWKQNNNRVPKAVCTRKLTSDGRILYEYKLEAGSDCVRYSCPKIGYTQNGGQILDERDIENKSSDLFKKYEVTDFIRITGTDYTSFINREETSKESTDKRGAFNGFAIWNGRNTEIGDLRCENLEDKYSGIPGIYATEPKDQRSGDFAIRVQASACLTGFAPAGANKSIYYGVHSIDEQSKYDNVSLSDGAFTKSFKEIIVTYKLQHISANALINNGSAPTRLCNQKGEWQAVDDIYNLLKIDTENQNNNFYYNNPGNFWFKNLWYTDGDVPELYSEKYCERLVCREMNLKNENIYLNEFLGSGLLKDKTWLQNGGAFWSATSTPRNSSHLIAYVEEGENNLAPSDSSRDIGNIYTKAPSDNFVENKYKYVKKVEGICRNEYGYYDRETIFNSDFTNQVDSISDRSDKKNTDLSFEDIRQKDDVNGSIDWYLIDKQVSVSPYRVCTSTGLWGGITNRCFRSCEMLDIFQTTIDEKLYKQGANFKDNFFVENHDIKTLNITSIQSISDDYKENRFKIMNLRNVPDFSPGSFIYGDYLTGGAQWPRSIVKINSQIETEGAKKGMRYVEIKGNCDKNYDNEKDNEPTQYVLNSKDNRPTRKCYEDGTWGPVNNTSRCVLSKSCLPFKLLAADLARLIKKSSESGGNDLLGLNKLLSEIYFIRKKGAESKTKNCGINSNQTNPAYYDSCKKIVEFDALNAVAGEAISHKKVFSEKNAIYYKKVNYDMTCNSSAQNGNYVTGWSFRELPLENYFVPKTCKFELEKGHFLANNINDLQNTSGSVAPGQLKRLIFSNTEENGAHYSKESLLAVVYNELKCLNDDNCSGGKYNEKFYNKDNVVVDDSYKAVSIGNKNYLSYQLSAICDNRYFYNDFTGDDYYNKHIVFECSGDKCGEDQNCKFMYSEKACINANSINFIKADACLAKTCGGNSDYQPSWSKSYVKEVINGEYDWSEGGKGLSKLDCNGARTEAGEDGRDKPGEAVVKSAFVVKSPGNFKDKKNTLTAYCNNNAAYCNDKYLDNNGLVESIKAECSAYRSEAYYASNKNPNNIPMSINGKNAKNTYDAHKYGDLLLDNIVGEEFCTDLAKTDCKKVTLAELADGERFRKGYSTSAGSAGGERFIKGYCVKMVCPKTGLKLDTTNNKILTDQTGDETFSLPGKEGDYTFDTVVAIQSLAGDFNYYTSKYSDDAPEPNLIYTQYGNSVTSDDCENISSDGNIGGQICPTGQDIYNKAIASPYNYFKYLEDNSHNSINIDMCFSKLETKESIKKGTWLLNCYFYRGYDNINGNTCVKYSSNKKKLDDIANNIENAIRKYRPVEETLKNKAANFIVDELFEPILSGNFGDEILKKYFEDNIIKVAEKYAKEEATKVFLKSSGNFCFYSDELVKDFNESNLTAVSLDDDKYSEIKFFEYTDGRIFGYIPKEISTFSGQEINQANVSGVCMSNLEGEYKYFIGLDNATQYTDAEGVEWEKEEDSKKCEKLEVCQMKITKRGNLVTCTKIEEKNNNICVIPNQISSYCSEGYTYKENTAKNSSSCGHSCGVNEECKNSFSKSSKSNIQSEEECKEECKEFTCTKTSEYNSGCLPIETPEGSIEIKEDEYCETGDTASKKICFLEPVVLEGEKYQLKSVFDEAYENAYKDKFTELKEEFRKSLVNNSSPNEFKELFNKYYKIFKMNDFLIADEKNIDYYNDFMSFAVNIPIEVFLGSTINSIIYLESIADSENNYLIEPSEMLTNTMDYCKTNSDLDKNNSLKRSCSATKDNLDKYKKFFLNFLDDPKCTDSECNARSMAEAYNTKIVADNEMCIEIYQKYISSQKDYMSKNYANVKFDNGLFMVMKCTPNGWVVIDQPKCVSRCNFTKKFDRDDLDRLTGGFDVTLEINDLRADKSVDIKYNSSFETTCIAGGAMSACRFEHKVTNKGGTCEYTPIENACRSKSQVGDNIAYDYSSSYNSLKVCRRCQANSYFNDDKIGEMIWGSVKGVSSYCQTKSTKICVPCPMKKCYKKSEDEEKGVCVPCQTQQICQTGGGKTSETCGNQYDTVTNIHYIIER